MYIYPGAIRDPEGFGYTETRSVALGDPQIAHGTASETRFNGF